MKKLLAILSVTATMMVLAFTMTSFAATSKDKAVNLSITIDTAGIDVGSEPDDYGKSNIQVKSISQAPDNDPTSDQYLWKGTEASGYEGLQVRINDIRCESPSRTLKIGDTVKFKMWVSVSGSSSEKDGVKYEYVTKSSANVSVRRDGNSTGPTIKSSSKTRSGDEYIITFYTNTLNGTYEEPQDVEWKSGSSLGQASWSAPDNGSGCYDIRLKRENKTVVTFTNVSAKTMNFYPWMTKEGDYTFDVRTVPSGDSSKGKKSDWVESDSQYVDKNHVSDGSGQFDPSGTGGGSGNTGGKVGWVKDGNTWYYIYPDGTMRKNGWEKVNNKWYYFDASGAMKTGWVTVNGQTYYLDATNGDMKVGWVKTSDGQWYYLNPNPAAGTEGAMYKNQWLVTGGQTYFLKDTGAMATGWLKIDGKFYYFNPNEGGPKGAMLKNTRIDSFYLGADGAWVQGA